jgi:hypothetical protein
VIINDGALERAWEQLLFFLDDLLSSLFGKPLLSDRPCRSPIA